jgi:hypothetical protein
MDEWRKKHRDPLAESAQGLDEECRDGSWGSDESLADATKGA